MMKFLVKKQQIDCIERDKLADGQIAFVSFRFVFDNEWEGLYKVVQFMQDENTYNISLGVDGYSCKMPSELQAGCAEMSLFGYVPDDETALRATTAPIKLRIEQSGFSSSGSEVVPPTPDLYQQLIAKIDEKIASVHDGADGASAYEIAVENGYTGTEAEWLSSLKGEKGDAGEQGIQGIQGEKGDTGEQGLQGIQGEKGEKGDTGAAGKDGTNGTDGKNGVDGSDGYSPTATVTETDTGATITITDKNGTTTATVKNGTNGDAASWGDYTPGCEEGESAKYCTAKLVTVTGKQTWRVLPSISTVSHNALDIVPDGLFVLDLSPDVDALKASAHTHDNKDVLDDITAAKWGAIKNAYHNHINMDVLNSLSPADLQRIQALPNTAGELKVLHANFDDTCSAKTVYVDAFKGSDTQDGSTQTNALQTLSMALQLTQYAGKAVIYLAAGEYTIPDKTLTLLGRDVRIYGDTAATTILHGNLVCENSFLLMRRVTIDSTDSTTANTTADTITLQYRGAIRMVDCAVNTAGKNAVSLTEMSNANLVNTTFQGATQYAVYVTGLSDAKIYTCTDAATKGVRSGGGSVVYINNATGTSFPYTSGSNGMVFVDGQQVLPQPGSIQLRHGKGTFNATATGTNVVWQYGGQQVQGSKCTFDVKSDNGLIRADFDKVMSLTITDDTALKMCLADLGGLITNSLTLTNCTNITGDLSDLGGNIVGVIALSNCSNITGDLSDLGGNITGSIILSGCTAITGSYYGTKYPKNFMVSKTSITAADMDANLINFAASGVKSGKFTAANMTRTAASDDAVATLVTNGWTVSGLKKEG